MAAGNACPSSAAGSAVVLQAASGRATRVSQSRFRRTEHLLGAGPIGAANGAARLPRWKLSYHGGDVNV
jgi:hypothetical protein